MILRAKDGLRGTFRHRLSGAVIHWMIEYNTVTGEYVAWKNDPDAGCRRKTKGKADLVFVPDREKMARVTLQEIQQQSRIQLPVEEVRCTTNPRRHRVSARRLDASLFEFHDCEHYGCIKYADWETADKEELPPERVVTMTKPIIAANGLILVPGKEKVKYFKRGAVVNTHYWCNQHYQPPGLVYPDGSIDPIEIQRGRPN
jgi:hypothetical protein